MNNDSFTLEEEHLEPPYITGENIKWHGCFGHQLAIPQNTKDRVTMGSSNPNPRYISR